MRIEIDSHRDRLAQMPIVAALHRAAPGDRHVFIGGFDRAHPFGQPVEGVWHIADGIVNGLRAVQADDYVVADLNQRKRVAFEQQRELPAVRHAILRHVNTAL